MSKDLYPTTLGIVNDWFTIIICPFRPFTCSEYFCIAKPALRGEIRYTRGYKLS